jgi:hypothetical protein
MWSDPKRTTSSQRCTKTDGTYGERTVSVRCQATPRHRRNADGIYDSTHNLGTPRLKSWSFFIFTGIKM